MCNDEFSKVFTGLTEPLDMFFHKKIRSSGIKQNIEELKMELIQTTALSVLVKLKRERYNDYNLIALIWVKAKDTWYEYMESMEKTAVFTYPSEEEINMIAIDIDPFAVFEQSHLLESLHESSDKASWDIAVMHADGYLYKDIADYFQITEGSIKMKMSRLRTKIGPQRPY